MVLFSEDVIDKEDHYFVKEDVARIYRNLKDLLVEEFDMDRIEEGHMEFNVKKPKDRIRLHAFKEKSPHTVLHFRLSWKAKEPRSIYKQDRSQDILKARVRVTADVLTVYPGGEPLSWVPEPVMDTPSNTFDKPGLKAEERTAFQKSKLYSILVGTWYSKFYSKEIEMYEEEAEEISLRIHNLMREKFGVKKSIHKTGASEYTPPWQ